MARVSVIGTVHEDSGLANASELLAILERIQPDVIFLEIPKAAFDDFRSGSHRELESTGVNRYLQIRQAALVPVDLPTPPGEFFWNHRELLNAIERRSPDYCRLIDQHGQYVRAYGFPYLNGEDCSTFWRELHETMLLAIESLADDRLTEIYQSWRSTNELRDKEMLRNIEEYCQHNASDNGVFLVGAAHRQSIIDKSRDQSGADSPRIQWDFDGFLAPRA